MFIILSPFSVPVSVRGLLVEVSPDEGGDPSGVEDQGARGGPAHDRGDGLVLSAGEPSCCPDC